MEETNFMEFPMTAILLKCHLLIWSDFLKMLTSCVLPIICKFTEERIFLSAHLHEVSKTQKELNKQAKHCLCSHALCAQTRAEKNLVLLQPALASSTSREPFPAHSYHRRTTGSCPSPGHLSYCC